MDNSIGRQLSFNFNTPVTRGLETPRTQEHHPAAPGDGVELGARSHVPGSWWTDGVPVGGKGNPRGLTVVGHQVPPEPDGGVNVGPGLRVYGHQLPSGEAAPRPASLPEGVVGRPMGYEIRTDGSITAPDGRTIANPVGHLGVMAQLDEPSAVHAVSKIDGPSQPAPNADLHIVGPSNAARFLSDPNQLYLGI